PDSDKPNSSGSERLVQLGKGADKNSKWTRNLGEAAKKDIMQGASAKSPKAFESLTDQYFEAMSLSFK
ncbi:MAG: hypothetical protein HRT89_13970, partial [Lentisphaeria bacterium]|nr:hypothetical protein [Lentisphaeria bacterium]